MGKIFAHRISKNTEKFGLKFSLIFVTECACATRDVTIGKGDFGATPE